MKFQKLKNSPQTIANWSLMATAMLGCVVGILDLFSDKVSVVGLTIDIKSISNPLMLVLLGLLGVGLGLEKIIRYQRFEEILERLGGSHLENWDEIYAVSKRLVGNAELEIQATAFGTGSWAGPSEYLELVARTAKFRKANQRDFLYKVVFDSFQTSDSQRMKHVLYRAEVFAKEKVFDALRIREIPMGLRFDILIIDRRSIIIAFPGVGTPGSAQPLRVGIKFENRPELVFPIAMWYDEQLWFRATDVDLDELRSSLKPNT